jgi:phosphoribosyl-ATP pyrophosphohydrolase
MKAFEVALYPYLKTDERRNITESYKLSLVQSRVDKKTVDESWEILRANEGKNGSKLGRGRNRKHQT